MPVPLPSEFRQRAIELARTSDKPLGDVATELGISRSCLQNWIRQDKADAFTLLAAGRHSQFHVVHPLVSQQLQAVVVTSCAEFGTLSVPTELGCRLICGPQQPTTA
jgi:helix-turn-helix protein